MKIEDRLSNYMSLLNSYSAKPATDKKEDTVQTALPESDAFNVELSSTATLKPEDKSRLDKLNAIRQQLAEGSYNISGKDVADKMLKILQ